MPSKNKAPKVAKSKGSKKSKIIEPIVLVETVAPVEPVALVPVEPVEPVEDSVKTTLESVHSELDYSEEINHLQNELKNTLLIIKNLLTHVSKLDKLIARDKKVVEKKMKTKPRRTSTGLNGFSKPGPVSDEMRKFLSLDKEDLIARTQVTKRITTYCIDNKLQYESDKRIILPDKALTKLLNIPKGEQLTYFNLQKYMKVHFPNKEGVYPTL